MDWLASLAVGKPTEEAQERLASAFRLWWTSGRQGPSLQRFLGLPDSPERARRELRNRYLREAAEMIEADTSWQRVTRLHAALRSFMGHEWHSWMDWEEPPFNATAIDALLWHAAKASAGRMPKTPERLHQILHALSIQAKKFSSSGATVEPSQQMEPM